MGDIGGVFLLFIFVSFRSIGYPSFFFYLSFIFLINTVLYLLWRREENVQQQSVSQWSLGLENRVSFPSHLISFAIGGREAGAVVLRGRQRPSRGAAGPFTFRFLSRG